MLVGVVSILLLPLFPFPSLVENLEWQASALWGARFLKKLGWPFDAEEPPYHPPESKFIYFWFLETSLTE